MTEKLAKLRDDVGGFGTLLVIGHEWEPPESWIRSMTILREQVLPRCRAASHGARTGVGCGREDGF